MRYTECDVDGVRDSEKPVEALRIVLGDEELNPDLCGDCAAQLRLAVRMALTPPAHKPEPSDPATDNADDTPDVEHIDGAKDPYNSAECRKWLQHMQYPVRNSGFIPKEFIRKYLAEHPHIVRPEWYAC